MTFSIQKERITAISPEGTPMGYITFPRVRAGLVNISQMTVSPDFRHQGVEDAMMEALLTHLEQQNQRAVLLCPFAQQYVETHPEWRIILPGDLHFTKY